MVVQFGALQPQQHELNATAAQEDSFLPVW
jgi:hypothetical protein